MFLLLHTFTAAHLSSLAREHPLDLNHLTIILSSLEFQLAGSLPFFFRFSTSNSSCLCSFVFLCTAVAAVSCTSFNSRTMLSMMAPRSWWPAATYIPAVRWFVPSSFHCAISWWTFLAAAKSLPHAHSQLRWSTSLSMMVPAKPFIVFKISIAMVGVLLIHSSLKSLLTVFFKSGWPNKV